MDKRHGILIVSVTLFVLCFLAAASATTWSVDGSGGADFAGIQDAINNASDGDTILVYSGVYYENVVVDKSVTLKGNGQPVVDAGGRKSAITLTADGITLVGFTATNSGSSWKDAGINVISNNNKITGNNVRNNDGIGIYLSSSSNNNTITGNNVSNNNYGGISLSYSSNNTITGNTFVNDGLSVYSSYQNTVENNTVNGKPLVYLEDASDYRIEDAGQVILVKCNNITVENLDISNTNSGIDLWETEDSKILNNIVCNNVIGIELYNSCNNNNITGNNVSSNKVYGIKIYDSCNNTITGNTASSNDYDGISLVSSSNNTISGNNVSTNNRDGISVDSSSNNNSITDNNAGNNHGGISLSSSSSNNSITGNNVCNNADGIDLSYSSNNNSITDNNVCNNSWYGICLTSSSNNTIKSNNVCNNNWGGIDLSSHSSNNSITGNNASNNNGDAISVMYSSNNKVYLNNFINNTDNVDSHGSTNIWNSPLEITYTYDGTTYESYVGNYWDDYEGTDAEGDGIGDTDYSIDSKEDENDDYPLMMPFENYNLTTSAPA
jgi:parallel beta-helix repeat protein